MNQENNVEEIKDNSFDSKKEKTTIIQTDVGAKDGLNKCPKCGSTDISPVGNGGKLKCHFCRHEFEPEKADGLSGDISKLEGKVISSGAQDIVSGETDIVTLKCSGCGAEVVIDTNEALQARCHWCRNTLSINQQVPNGSVPDVVLPFYISKEDAMAEIQKFVSKRNFFAHPKFVKEFTTENICGVFFPYMIVDVNAHCRFTGQGEHQTRSYRVKSGDNYVTRYDADLYDVQREFDIEIDDLAVESSADKLDKNSEDKTNNVINAIMPFDLMNVVKWDANYLKGYTSEKRDLNIDQIKPHVSAQAKDVARFAANDSLQFYDRGVRWDSQDINVKGEKWSSAYLPVWLYSYQQKKGNKSILHYVAVNGRTKEVMGSIPINMFRLLFVSILVGLIFFGIWCEVDFEGDVLFLTPGFITYFVIYYRYRNKDARHRHEVETRRKVLNLQQADKYVIDKKGLSNHIMTGANNNVVDGAGKQNFMTKVIEQNNLNKK